MIPDSKLRNKIHAFWRNRAVRKETTELDSDEYEFESIEDQPRYNPSKKRWEFFVNFTNTSPAWVGVHNINKRFMEKFYREHPDIAQLIRTTPT